MRQGSSTVEKIVKLFKDGIAPAIIQTKLKCSKAHVYNTLRERGFKMRKTWNHTIASLPPDRLGWLMAEAKRRETNIAVLARALLIIAIDDRRKK